MNEVKEVNINIPKKAVVISKYNDSTGWVYFLSMIGAAVYFWQGVSGFWEGVVAILKAFVWPAYAVFYLLKFLGV